MNSEENKTADKEPLTPVGFIGGVFVWAIRGGIVIAVGSMLTTCVTPSPPSEKEKLENKVGIQCHKLVKKHAKFPSKADFPASGGGYYPKISNSEQVVFAGTVEFMNGLGAMIPHKFICKYDKRTKEYTVPLVSQGG